MKEERSSPYAICAIFLQKQGEVEISFQKRAISLLLTAHQSLRLDFLVLSPFQTTS
jgi:hypothetical protein